MSAAAPQRRTKKVSEVRNIAVDMSGKLDSGETLTGTPTVEEVTTTDLTLTNKIVNTAETVINDRTVAIGFAVQFRVSGGVAGTTYTVRITCATSANQTVVENVILRVIANS